MMQVILRLYDGAKAQIDKAIPLSQLKATGIFDELTKLKYEVPNGENEKFAEYDRQIDDALAKVWAANQER
jgi:V/A-type H+-transporting ATPase subunit A